MPTTTEDVERVTHLALEKTGGDRAAAAKLLGVTTQQLHNRINNNKGLKLKWGKQKEVAQPPDASITIHRPGIGGEEPALLLPSEIQTAEAMAKEDEAVRKGLEKMGLSEKEADLANALKNFQRGHYKSGLQIMSGGLVKMSLRIMVQIEEIEERLADGKKESDFPLTLQEEMLLRDHHTKLLELLGKFNDKANTSMLTQAKVIALLRQKNDKDKPERPKGVLDLSGGAHES